MKVDVKRLSLKGVVRRHTTKALSSKFINQYSDAKKHFNFNIAFNTSGSWA